MSKKPTTPKARKQSKPLPPPCAACGQHPPMVRPRKIHSTMARQLIALVKLFDGNGNHWVHGVEIVAHVAGVPAQTIRGVSAGDFVKLSHWGLIEAKPKGIDPSKKSSGYWKPTPLGIAFARNEIRLAKYAEIQDKKVLRLDDSKTVSIVDALGKRFHYTQLMRDSLNATSRHEGNS